MEFIEWKWNTGDGLEMYSGEWLPSGKPRAVLCLVHGVGEHIGRYKWIGEALTNAGYILSGFDQRGFGRSQGKRGFTTSLDAYFDDITAFLMQVGGRHPNLPIFLYGHSMGAILVMAYTPERHPDISGVIATGPGIRSALEKQKMKVFLTKLLGKVYPGLTLQSGIDVNEICRDPKVVEAYINDPYVHSLVSAGWGLAMLKAIDLIKQDAPRFPLPLLLMHATGDTIAYPSSSTEFAEIAPKDKVTIKMWEGMKHEVHNDPDREQVFKYMIDWLNRHLP